MYFNSKFITIFMYFIIRNVKTKLLYYIKKLYTIQNQKILYNVFVIPRSEQPER